MTTYTVTRRWQTKDTLTIVDAETPAEAYAAYAAGCEDEPLDDTDVIIAEAVNSTGDNDAMTRTIADRARDTWAKYGREDAKGRCYLADEYIGRRGCTSDGLPMYFLPHERRVGYFDRLGLVCAYLSR